MLILRVPAFRAAAVVGTMRFRLPSCCARNVAGGNRELLRCQLDPAGAYSA